MLHEIGFIDRAHPFTDSLKLTLLTTPLSSLAETDFIGQAPFQLY
jgi:hypothetical protein